ncbi:MAG: anaerobic ribonucleoside-triphosphate reductase activating protein [Candidatus Altiarchaeota archaeon]|nr:anaerobic ribonucleoside-triphosphate reductase activating protein [Candidatus Altiarchaeota archaeon]
MKIGGLQQLSLIDYPRRLSCIIFTMGCNLRCPYCYNPDLVKETAAEIPEEYIFKFLDERKDLLDAVVITGGEPTIHPDLPEFMEKIKTKGFLIGLETNGTNPEMLEKLLEDGLVDYIGMDIKAPLEKYKEIAGVEINPEKLRKSIRIVMNSQREYEFRTTCYPKLKEEDFQGIFRLIEGAKKYTLQQFSPERTLAESPKPYPQEFLKGLKEKARKHFTEVNLRL